MSILNEITYSDGRMDMQQTEFVDTPAKLKLRANTFAGINRSLNARRNPAKRVNEFNFNIPNAYMAMDIPNGDNAGGNGFTIVEGNLSAQQLHESSTRKRLKVKPMQRDLFVAKSSSVTANATVNQPAPVAEQPVMERPVVAPQAEVVSEVTPEAVAPVVAETAPVVEQPVVQEEVKPATSIDDQIDAAREKVLHSDLVQQAENMDSFAKLQMATEEYGKMNEDTRVAEEQLASKQEELEGLKKQYSGMEENLESKETELHERMEVIGKHERDTAQINEEIDSLNKKIEEKLRYVQELKKKKAEEMKKKEAEAAKVSQEAEEYQRKIDERQNKVNELAERSKALEEQEKVALEAREQAQRTLEEKKALFEAITLPELEGTEIEETQEEVADVDSNIVDFPVVNEENVETDYEEGTSMVRSIGGRAA